MSIVSVALLSSIESWQTGEVHKLAQDCGHERFGGHHNVRIPTADRMEVARQCELQKYGGRPS